MTFSAMQLKKPIGLKRYFRHGANCKISCDIVLFGIRLDDAGHVYFIPWSSIEWVEKGDHEIFRDPPTITANKGSKSKKGPSRKPTPTPRKGKRK